MLTNNTFKVWLYSPTPAGTGTHFQSVITHLQAARIECLPCQTPEGKSTILFFLDDQITEEQERECLQMMQEPDQHVIAVYGGEKKLPFHRVWRLLSMGVDDVYDLQNKPDICQTICSRLQRWSVIEKIVESEQVKKTLIGSCNTWRKVLRQVVEMACFSTAPILILGESGTGKELIARLVHDLDKRQDKQSLVLLD